MPNASYTFYQSGEPAYAIEGELPVDISSTGHETRTSLDYRWDNQRHRFARNHILQYTLLGSGIFEFDLDGERHREQVGPGRMFIASWDRNFEYFFEGNSPWDFLWITLGGSFADRIIQDLREPLPLLDLGLDAAPVVLLRNFLERLALPGRIDHYALSCIGYEILVLLLKEKSRSGRSPEDRLVMEAREYVTRNIRIASVGALASHFGYSEKYFSEYFRRRAGATPNRFIIEERVRYASSLLVNTRKKIAAIAQEAGFSEDNYFSKVFKKYRGLAPAQYREANKDQRPVSEIVIL